MFFRVLFGKNRTNWTHCDTLYFTRDINLFTRWTDFPLLFILWLEYRFWNCWWYGSIHFDCDICIFWCFVGLRRTCIVILQGNLNITYGYSNIYSLFWFLQKFHNWSAYFKVQRLNLVQMNNAFRDSQKTTVAVNEAYKPVPQNETAL